MTSRNGPPPAGFSDELKYFSPLLSVPDARNANPNQGGLTCVQPVNCARSISTFSQPAGLVVQLPPRLNDACPTFVVELYAGPGQDVASEPDQGVVTR